VVRRLGSGEEHRLTIYDAAYLELALRQKLLPATLDKQLHGAALALGVALVPEITK
jgi:predicted nucleic acid-binding protein